MIIFNATTSLAVIKQKIIKANTKYARTVLFKPLRLNLCPFGTLNVRRVYKIQHHRVSIHLGQLIYIS